MLDMTGHERQEVRCELGVVQLSSDKRVEFYKKGKAGLEEFKENLDDSKILLGGFRVTGVDKEHGRYDRNSC